MSDRDYDFYDRYDMACDRLGGNCSRIITDFVALPQPMINHVHDLDRVPDTLISYPYRS